MCVCVCLCVSVWLCLCLCVSVSVWKGGGTERNAFDQLKSKNCCLISFTESFIMVLHIGIVSMALQCTHCCLHTIKPQYSRQGGVLMKILRKFLSIIH